MFIAALFMIVKKKMECPSTGKWDDKMYTDTMEYYHSAIKRNKLQIHAATGMNLEDMFSERSQTGKPHTV